MNKKQLSLIVGMPAPELIRLRAEIQYAALRLRQKGFTRAAQFVHLSAGRPLDDWEKRLEREEQRKHEQLPF